MKLLSKQDSSSPLPVLSGLREVADRYDVFLLDIWGVLWNGVEIYDGVHECLEQMHKAGKTVAFLSNSPRRAEQIESFFTDRGIRREWFRAAITSGEVAYRLLKENAFPGLGRKFYNPWKDDITPYNDPIHSPLLPSDLDFEPVNDVHQADFLFGGLAFNAHTLPEFDDVLGVAFSRNLPFLCANPDRVVTVGENTYMMAGRVAEHYEQMGGKVFWIGKPYPAVYDAALRALGSPDKTRVVAIGDSLLTDIAGAAGADISGIFNMTGIHWEELRMDHAPDRHDAEKLEAFLAAHPHRPTAALCGLRWA